jgi:hypothetical protein
VSDDYVEDDEANTNVVMQDLNRSLEGAIRERQNLEQVHMVEPAIIHNHNLSIITPYCGGGGETGDVRASQDKFK